MSNHLGLGEDVVHVRLSRTEIACLRTVLEVAGDDPYGEMTDQIDALATRLRQLQEALG